MRERQINSIDLEKRAKTGELIHAYEVLQEVLHMENQCREQHGLSALFPVPHYSQLQNILSVEWLSNGLHRALRFEYDPDDVNTIVVKAQVTQRGQTSKVNPQTSAKQTTADIDWIQVRGDRDYIPDSLRRAYQIASTATPESLEKRFLAVETCMLSAELYQAS